MTTVATPAVVTLTAATTSGGSPVTKGVVNFCYSTQLACSGAALVGTAQLTAAGTASISFRPAVGSHSYEAVFLGTGSVATSTSAVSTLSVTQGMAPVMATATAIASSGSAGDYTLTGTVTGDGLTVPGGNVNFVDLTNGNAVVGMATLGGGTSGPGFLTVPGTTDFKNAYPLAAGDFNGDGIPDLISALSDGSVVSQLGNGDGSFTTHATIPGGAGEVITGDFNSDGKLDLAVTVDGGVQIFLGDGAGGFTAVSGSPLIKITPIFSLAVGDFNQDGVLDLAMTDGQTLYIYTGVGDGTFQAGYSFFVVPSTIGVMTSGANGLAVGDFNADGHPDLAVAWIDENGFATPLPDFDISVFFGDGTGNFTSSQVTLPATSLVVAILPFQPVYSESPYAMLMVPNDVNGDGKTDLTVLASLIVCCVELQATGTLQVLNNGDGTFTTTGGGTVGLGPPLAAATLDLNGDGTTQIATWWEPVPPQLPGGGITQQHIDYGSGHVLIPSGAGSGFIAGDFNGDGIPDIAIGGPIATSLVGLQTVVTGTANHVALSPAGSGMHQVEASYPGDTIHAASVSPAVSLSSGPATSAITVTVPGPGAFGTAVTLTAMVTASAGTPTGTVTFYNGTATLGASPLNNGIATYSVSGLTPGNYSITATYSGDSSHPAATSAAVTLTVNKATSTIILAAPGPITFGIAEALTATVTSPGGTPTGTVTFLNGAATLGTSPLNNGVATLSVPKLASGSYSLTATYSGDADNAGSTSAAVTLIVNKASSAITLTATPGMSTVGAHETLVATLPATDTAGGGSVTFYLGGTVLGTSPVSGNSASFTTSSLPAGKDSFTATWTGDSNFSGTTSAANVVMIAPLVTLSSSAGTIYSGVSDTVTVTLGTGGNPTVPTGTVTLTSGSYTSAATSLASGSATIQIPANTLSTGNDTLVASYSGDAVYPSGSGRIVLIVSTDPPPGFTISANSLTVTAGATTGDTVAIKLTPVTGFTGSVTLAAQVTSSPTDAHDAPTLTFQGGNTAAISGSTPVTATLLVTTTGSTTARNDSREGGKMRWLTADGAVLAGVFLVGLSRRRNKLLSRLRNLMLLPILLIVLTLFMNACGGSHKMTTMPGTTPGAYVVTVTGTSGSVTSSGTVTVTVQ